MNSHSLRLRLLGLLVALVTAGCGVLGQSFTSTPAPLPPTAAAATALPSATNAPTAQPISTPTLVPSPSAATESPSSTVAPTRRPTSTRADTATAVPTATDEPDIAATLTAGSSGRLYAAYPSPDGRSRAEVHIFDCAPFPDGLEYAYDRLQIVDTASGEARFIDGQLQSCGGLGAFGLAGLFWSPSGRFFYYTEAREGMPDGCGFWSRPISRADTTAGTAADLGGGPLSPDGTRLAVWDGRDLVVYEVDGGEIGRATAIEPSAALGPIVWSPDGQSLAYVQAGMFCIPGQSGSTTVARVDLPALTSRVLLRSADPAFQTVAWDELAALRLGDDAGREWRMDATNGELSAAP